MEKILIVDDQENVRQVLKFILGDEYAILTAADGRQALLAMGEAPDLVVLDIKLPDVDGLEVLKRIRRLDPHLPVIMLSGIDRVKTVVEAMKLGAVDYLAKPFDHEELKLVVGKMLAIRALNQEVSYLKSITADYRHPEFIGSGPAAVMVRENVARYAANAASVLISGESGVGKEVVAKLVHYRGARRAKPFVPVHCAAVPENLFESELFGYEKGAFTDAAKRKEGMFDLARDGTIFFDEVGEMPAATQVKLLRVLQEREYMRLGGGRMIRTEARVLAATARDLENDVAAGGFRRDLFYRLNVLNLRIPPLRERREDIPELVDHFFHLLRRTIRVRVESFSPGAMSLLTDYAWPGNVRELRNVLERVLVLYGGKKTVTESDVAACLSAAPARRDESNTAPVSLDEAVRTYEGRLIREALGKTGGVKSAAARRLKTTRRILAYRMRQLGIAGDGTS